jgi:hypothetical protein
LLAAQRAAIVKVYTKLKITFLISTAHIELFLIPNVIPDLRLFKTNSRNSIASCPKPLTVKVSLPSSKLPGYCNRCLSFQLTHYF